MVRKKKRQDTNKLECWYCKRQFDDEHTMVTHMRAKHFKCQACKKKLNSAAGLKIHLFSVHKLTIQLVPNALPGRDAIDAVPDDSVAAAIDNDDTNNNNNPNDDDDDDSDAASNEAKRPRSASAVPAVPMPTTAPLMMGMPHAAMMGMPPMGIMGLGMPLGMGLPPGFVPPVPGATTPAATAAAAVLTTSTTDGNVLSAAATMAPSDGPSTSHLVYDDEDEQMEEKRAQLRKHVVSDTA